MDFRNEACAWCQRRTRPLHECQACPRYEGRPTAAILTADQLCGVCRNCDALELEVFCRTNRLYQHESGENFECYKFDLDRSPV